MLFGVESQSREDSNREGYNHRVRLTWNLAIKMIVVSPVLQIFQVQYLLLTGVLNDRDNTLEFFRGKFSGTADSSELVHSIHSFEHCLPLAEIDIGLLADQVGVTTTNTLDFGQGEHDLLLSFDVGID